MERRILQKLSHEQNLHKDGIVLQSYLLNQNHTDLKTFETTNFGQLQA